MFGGKSREQVFDRRSAVKLYRIFAAEHGVVNLDASYWQTSCDGSPVPKPCYTAPGSVLCRSFPSDDLTRCGWRLLHRQNGGMHPRFGKGSFPGIHPIILRFGLTSPP